MAFIHFPVSICGGFPGLPCSPYSHWSLYRGTSSYLVSDILRTHGLTEARELTILVLSEISQVVRSKIP